MAEQWALIEDFPDYSVSDHGRVRSNKTGRILVLTVNQFGLQQVGLRRDGRQWHRSVPLLVAKAFLPELPVRHKRPFDTPINLDGNRLNNHVSNLAWRPRWFAIMYNRQFQQPYENPILTPVVDLNSGEISDSSTDAAKRYGLLEKDLVLSILNRTYVWPTYQEFAIYEKSY